MTLFSSFGFGIVGLALLLPQRGYANEVAAPAGYAMVNEREWNRLNGMSVDLLSDARRDFQKGEFLAAGQDLHFAALLMKIQAVNGSVEDHLGQDADQLEKFSKQVSANEVKSNDDFDLALARAARSNARSHYLHATESWAQHFSKTTGDELAAAQRAIVKSAEWSMKTVRKAGGKVLTETENVTTKAAEKVASGAEWTEAEIKKGFASLESEFKTKEE